MLFFEDEEEEEEEEEDGMGMGVIKQLDALGDSALFCSSQVP